MTKKPRTKLSAIQVRDIFIRVHNGEKQKIIASDYGIDQRIVSRIKLGTYRKDLGLLESMEKFLSDIHKQIGGVAGEIAIALATRKVHGGNFTLSRWAKYLREAADKIEEKVNADSN
jgi:hypothetical protein